MNVVQVPWFAVEQHATVLFGLHEGAVHCVVDPRTVPSMVVLRDATTGVVTVATVNPHALASVLIPDESDALNNLRAAGFTIERIP